EDNSYYEKILATGEVKCIDDEIPFEIPATWNWARLSNITSILGDGIHGTPEYDATGTVYFINGNNLGNGSIEIKADTKKVSEQEAEKHKRLLNSTTVLVSINGTLGNVAFYNGENVILGKSACYFNLMGNIDKQYIKHILETEYFTEYAKNVATGSTIKNVPLAGMRNFLIPVPPITEQHRIILGMVRLAHSIDRYNDAQTKLDLLNNVLNEKLKKSVLQEAIQGKLVPQLAEEGTAQELLEQIKAEKLKLVKEGKLKKSALNESVIFRGDDNKYYEQIGKKCLDITEQIPFEIPSNWEWCRVRNVSNSYIGLTYKPTDIDEKGTIVLRSCNIRNGKLALDDIVRVSSSISEKLLIEENDIIICARNGSKRLVGKSALIRNLTEPMTFGAFMAICKTPIYEYMFAYLQSDLFFGQLRDVSNTTTINQLTQNKFNDFLIPIPPVKEQERIAFKISQLFQELR
ncbi:restriction endonuclease subunit S, partial [Prevotellamassilia timonensis]|uniref:restriction endonuclease subunit S n=1 Tax=Prevotellamassilia timonensis TaxID=1852370 RepID=UPI0023F2FF7C